MSGKKPYFDPVSPKVNFPLLEEKIINFWKKEKIFEKSVEGRPKNKRWTFLDGPPFITGLPHYGTLLSSIPKDIFPRYWTMKGYRVRRVWGWDCHGLPAENKVENKLGIKSKKEIEEKIGIKKFIEECKLYVSETSSEWEWYIDHIGRWVDFKNAYKTMDVPYMESVMWVFRSMYDKGYIYKGLRVSLYCPHCETPISNFEVAMDTENYKDLTEPATTYKYPLEGEENTYLLAWSTTPWNKIATPSLAVNPNLKYVKVRQGKEKYILAKETLKILKEEPKYKILEEFKGSELVGRKFIPHYDYYRDKVDPSKKVFVVAPADYVSSDEGTGIVTLAVYGEEDLDIMVKENIHMEMHVNDNGFIKKDIPKFGGMYYMDANETVDSDLQQRGLIYKKEPVTHTIPHCWRCGTRLFHNPQNAWYIDIQVLKPAMKKNNKKINWVPKHFKYGRFLKSMEVAPDWCISRSRYWGSPVPVWECECGERYIPGSIAELETFSGRKITDLHKPEIDEVTITCKNCGRQAKRVPEVLDSWIEAGSAPFAERHFPFKKELDLSEFFPPDFVVEYTGQIRAWFYVLHVISTALYDSHAFENVLVTGVILGTDGRKMSKNFGNYPDPKEMLKTYGGDALRLYLMKAPVMKGEDIRISEQDYREQLKSFLLLFWNVYNFFVTYANLDGWNPGQRTKDKGQSNNILDKWITSLSLKLNEDVTNSLERFDTITGIQLLQEFLNDLSRWYIRRSRDRVGVTEKNSDDKNSFYKVTYEILVNFCKLISVFAPFTSEEVYRNLTKETSIHLSFWPKDNEKVDLELLKKMQAIRDLVERVHSQRKLKGIPVRQPLTCFKTNYPNPGSDLEELVKDEVNVKNVLWGKLKGKDLKVELDIKITPSLLEEAKTRELIRIIQEKRKEMRIGLTQNILVKNPWIPSSQDLIQKLKKVTYTSRIYKGDFDVRKT
ncbi:isoleucine--tRNA ligase [Candidatus Woesebacteria bacterium RIFCSPHIGHO2_01_FULL_39_32]|uniref:Isoleucine--tRNA ligase n=1 Tax=Candidatus Woesebacteria bacterium RIFCSPLOWO2_01_FULL_39_25 TaxID=1802521 RepID=A0A1F8BM32_9BACT|nr:MAG: isoleucine--tRNA ligase [Candidatus Woesebacteria bacterium GWB1_37_5]OGM25479.1 MAG: isoleucine--tRNA ligase [Candidatus Woesebacteria bacterium RIFCSPHIGHO2_01_FULL_39_32]OGM38748.1 MAG: isoleucine--tRNA ligase [Candidatus Woesebacteria bacterium RIFCSPHIGHO2_12_FULL_38_11]OGM65010.1 MAG: isoleucine--tRNA ligase [Candidatus Woesebacteria bacterium RIFCSPLOWO2_01_FULL_39_25]